MATYQENTATVENASIPQQEAAHVIDVDFNKVEASSAMLVPLYGEPGFAKYARSLDTRSIGYRVVKRLFDLVFSCIVVVITFIPLLILSIFIAIDTKAFPIYSHERVEQVIIRHNFRSCLLNRLNDQFDYLRELACVKSKCAFGGRATSSCLAVSM